MRIDENKHYLKINWKVYENSNFNAITEMNAQDWEFLLSRDPVGVFVRGRILLDPRCGAEFCLGENVFRVVDIICRMIW